MTNLAKITNIHDRTIHLSLHAEKDREKDVSYLLLSLWDHEEQARNGGAYIALELTSGQLHQIDRGDERETALPVTYVAKLEDALRRINAVATVARSSPGVDVYGDIAGVANHALGQKP